MPKIIISSNNKKLKKYLLSHSAESFKCIYADDNKDEHFIKFLHERGDIEIEEINYDNQFRECFCKEYIDLIGKLGARYNSIYWWVTFVSSKNRFASRLVNNLSSLYSMVDNIKRYKDTNILIVVSDNPVLLVLKKYLKECNIKFISFENNIFQLICHVADILKSFLSAMIFIFRTWKKIYISRIYLRKILKESMKNKSYYAIKTFIYDTSFDASGNYHDSFFGILPEYVREKKETLILGDILGNYRKCITNIQGNHTFLIVPLECLISYLDPIKVVLRTFINKITIKKEVKFLDFEISGIINAEINKDYKKGSPFLQYLHYICIKNLLKLVKLETFVLTHENNPWERMCILALRQYSPATRIVGYQHTVVPQASANMFISEFEKDVVPLPDKILTVGSIPKRIMEQYGFYRKGQIEESCALRFEYLFKVHNTKRSKTGQILVVLEGIFEVYKLVNYVLRELKDIKDLKIKIRTHPVLPLDSFKHKILYKTEDLPSVSFSNNTTVRSDVEASDIVIYWGSTVALEALMMGKPVIHFDMQTILSYDPLFENKHMKWKVTSKDKLINTIQEIYNMEDAVFYKEQELAKKYLDSYFYSVNEEALSKFIN